MSTFRDRLGRDPKAPFKRRRTKVISQCPVPALVAVTENWNTGPVSAVLRPGSVVTSLQTYDDVVTPNFRKLISEGFFVNNPMSKQTTSVSIAPCTLTYVLNNRPYGAYQSTITASGVTVDYDMAALSTYPTQGWAPLKPEIDLDPRRALTRAYASANGQSSALLVELAELRKTLDTMSGLLADLEHRMYQFARNLNPTQLRKTIKRGVKIFTGGKKAKRAILAGREGVASAGSRWLQWHYGVMPTVLSIEDARRSIQEILDRSFRVTGRGVDSDSRTATGSYSGSRVYWFAGLLQPYTITDTIVVEGKARAYVIVEGRLSVGHILGSDLTAIPGAVYELIPYSWMADWCLNIGDWLAALNIAPGTSVRASGVVVETLTTGIRQLSYSAHNGSGGSGQSYWTASASAGVTTSIKSTVVKNRVVNLDVPVTPQVTGLRKALKPLTHRLDVLSLGFQRLGRRS